MSIIRTTDDLIRRFRSDVDDPLRGPVSAPDNDSLWSIQDVSDYMTEAASMVGRKTEVIFKTFTLQVVANQPLVALPKGSAYVFDVRRAYLQSIKHKIDEMNIEQILRSHWDYGYLNGVEDWEQWQGTPRYFIRNYVPGQLRLVPIPEANDTLELTAMFVPLLDDGMPLPFEDPEDIALMLLWMKKMAYSKHDADTFDEKRASAFEAEFHRRALERNSEARRVRRAPQPVTFSW